MKSTKTHVSRPQRRIDKVKQIIAVGSGKGGVGKSTTAINLALALAEQHHRVGLLDADIYGPNQPHMLGANGRPELIDNRFVPVSAHGLQTMSVGYLIEDDTPLIWRGPMVTKMLQQMLYQTAWDTLDYLVLDLPPGTGDVQLTLAKNTPLAGAIIVTTPQDIAAMDAKKGLDMFRKVDVPILGIIENMSTHTCSACGHNEPIFGSHGGEKLAQLADCELLGQLPLHRLFREAGDNGQPFVKQYPNDPATHTFHNMAKKIHTTLDLLFQQKSSTFPDIVVE